MREIRGPGVMCIFAFPYSRSSTSPLFAGLVCHFLFQVGDSGRELCKERPELRARVRVREGPIGVRITLGRPTISNGRTDGCCLP